MPRKVKGEQYCTPRKTRLCYTEAQILLGIHLKELGVENIAYEYRFNPDRQWRADLCLVDAGILIECDGGLFRGGHKRGAALAEDYERQNWATMSGFRVLRFTNQQILTGEAKKFLQEYLP